MLCRSTRCATHALTLFLLVAIAPPAEAAVVEKVTFATNVVSGTTNDHPVKVRAKLFLPEKPHFPLSAVVIAPSSSGVQKEREIHYAKALSREGIAALVVDSYGSRGLESSVYNQKLLDSWDIENDAIAALLWLTDDPRFDPDKIGILGVSKGGSVAMDTALEIRREWMGVSDVAFAAHVAISPDCTWVNRSTRTTGAPIFFMLAELDDQTPAEACLTQAARLRTEGDAGQVKVKVYEGAHHAWEELGKRPVFDPDAENYAQCRVWVEDDGSMVSADDGRPVPEDDWHGWAKKNCMTLGAHCCGGTRALKRQATADIIAFLKENGF
jgi:dienelactone hydrolase